MKRNTNHAKKLFLSLFVMFLPLLASSHNFEVDGIYYNVTSQADRTVSVSFRGSTYSEYTNEYTGVVTIPATVTYNSTTYRVTSIDEWAFCSCYQLAKINIPEEVTVIGNDAFRDCRQLSSVNFSDNITEIGEYAFYHCDALTSIVIPDGVTAIGHWAFAYCSSLAEIDIPISVKSFGYCVFYGCSAITYITIPEGVTWIRESLFSGCSNLAMISIPEGVTSISKNAFYGCSSLTTVVLPKSLQSLGSKAFAECSKLTNIYSKSRQVVKASSDAFDGSYMYATLHVTASVLNAYKSTVPWSNFGKFETLEATVDNITLNLSTATLTEGETLTLTATVIPDDVADKSISWSSSNTTVASVDANGQVTAIAPGTATITVTANDGSGVSASCKIKVINQPEDAEGQFKKGDTFKYTNSEGVVKTYKVVGENLIENPSFDNGTTGWTGGGGGSLTGVDWHSNGGVDDGAYLRLTENAGKGGNGSIGTAWDVEVGKTYVFSFFMKNQTNTAAESPAGYGYIKVSMSNTYRDETLVLQPLPHVDAGLAWTQNTWVVTAEYTSLALCARWLGGSKCFDSFILAEVEEVGDNKDLEDLLVASITLSQSSATLTEGETLTLTATVSPDDAEDKSISWSSNNPSIATVDNMGKVTAIASGTATITATANDGSGVSASCEVRVLPVSSETQNFQNVSTLYYTIQAIDEDNVWSTKSAKISFETINKLIGTKTPVLYGLNSPSTIEATGEYYSKNYTMGEQPGFWLTQEGYQSYWGGDIPWGMTGFNSTADDFVIQCLQMDGFGAVGDTYNASVYLVNEENLKMITINLTYQIVDALEFIATYLIDGCVYKQVPIKTGDPINLTDYPIKEGYTFQGWEGPTIMPARDVEIIGTYEINKYSLKYMLEGKVYKEYSVKFKEVVPKAGNPIKEGYTFCGWSEIPDSMPAHNVNIYGDFIVNYYEVSYVINQDTIFKDTIAFGDEIPEYNAPIKEGYTFNGWDAPQTMPAKNIVLTGSYTINKYQLSYVVDGELYYTIDITYNDSIVPLSTTPYKEGYTFMGWSKIPEVMPARDLTISGTFKKNKYLVSFIIDDVVIVSDSLEYGDAIIIPTIPNLEGHTFSGWGDVAETVPANDVTYSAYYIANVYKVYYFVGSKLVNMVEVTYGEPIPEYIYEPTTEGDEFLGWIGDTYETMPAHDVTYTANIESGINQITIDNGQLNIYDLMGRKVTDTENLTGGIHIIGGKKVIIK